MLAAWWWIDKWRKSTAYNDMTAEEQGLYRNLLDECWLRPNGVIPDDPRILERVSGDHEAWKRSGTKVLRWFTKVDGGYVHETALAVIQQSRHRAERQRRYREQHGHNGHEANNGHDPTLKSLPADPSTRSPKTTWLTPFADIWTESIGVFDCAMAARFLKPVVDAVGLEDAVRRFRLYVEYAEDRGKLSYPHFARSYLTVDQPKRGRSTTHDNRDAIHRVLRDVAAKEKPHDQS